MSMPKESEDAGGEKSIRREREEEHGTEKLV